MHLDGPKMPGKIEGKRTRGGQRMRWLDSITNSVDMNWAKSGKKGKDRETQRAAIHGVAKSWIRLSDWTTTIATITATTTTWWFIHQFTGSQSLEPVHIKRNSQQGWVAQLEYGGQITVWLPPWTNAVAQGPSFTSLSPSFVAACFLPYQSLGRLWMLEDRYGDIFILDMLRF